MAVASVSYLVALFIKYYLVSAIDQVLIPSTE